MGGFEIKTSLFQVAEELFNAPSRPVKIEGFFACEAIAHDVEMAVPPAFALDDLAGKKDPHSPQILSLRSFRFSCDPMFSRWFLSDGDVVFESDDVADALVVQPFEPLLTAELTIHGQDVDLLRIHDLEKRFENRNSLPSVGVSSFGLLGKDFPDDGDGDFVDDDSNSENVDMTFPVLPIRTIHGESPTFQGFGDFPQNESTERDQGDGAVEEEILKSAVATFVLGPC